MLLLCGCGVFFFRGEKNRKDERYGYTYEIHDEFLTLKLITDKVYIFFLLFFCKVIFFGGVGGEGG